MNWLAYVFGHLTPEQWEHFLVIDKRNQNEGPCPFVDQLLAVCEARAEFNASAVTMAFLPAAVEMRETYNWTNGYRTEGAVQFTRMMRGHVIKYGPRTHRRARMRDGLVADIIGQYDDTITHVECEVSGTIEAAR